MRPDPKKRIETNAARQPREGLNSAFSHLEVSNLPAAADAPEASAEPLWKLGRVVLRRETAHRGGKTVIIVHDFAPHLPQSLIERIAKKLRQACGCGGTVRERTIEIQGDQPGKVRDVLEAEGFQASGVR